MRPNQHADVRFFGCNLLSEQIDLRWRSDDAQVSAAHPPYSEQQRADLASTLLSMLHSADALDLGADPIHLKEKIASLLAAVAVRRWPASDPNLLQSLLSLADRSYHHLLLICMILRQVAEAISAEPSGANPSLSATTLSLVGTALTQFVNDGPCFEILYRYLERVYGESRQPGADPHLATLLVGIMRALQALADTVPVALFFSAPVAEQHSFAQVSVLLLAHADYQVQHIAADLLVVIFSRCISSTTNGQAALFLFDHTAALSSFASSTVGAVERARDSGDAHSWNATYSLLKRLVQLLVLLGLVEIDLTESERGVEAAHPGYTQFLQLMLDLSCFGSIQVLGLAVGFWRRWFSSEAIQQRSPADYRFVAASFLRNSRLSFLNWPFEWAPDLAALQDGQLRQLRAYQQLDFEDRLDWQHAFGSLRSDLTTILRSISGIAPDLTIESALQLLQLVAGLPASAGAVVFEGVSRIFKSLSSLQSGFKLLEGPIGSVLGALFAHTPRNAAEFVAFMPCVKHATPFYRLQSSWMERAVTSTLQSMTVAFPGDPLERECRREACVAFSHLANQLATELLPHLASVSSMARPLMNCELLLTQDRMMVLEGLAGVASVAPASDAARLLTDILADPLQQFQSDAIVTMCSSLDAFCAFCGITSLEREDSAGLTRGKNNRHQLQAILQTLTVVWKKTQRGAAQSLHPLCEHDPAVLSRTCSILKCLHSLAMPELRRELQSRFGAEFVFEPEDSLVRAWLRREFVHHGISQQQEIRSWLWNVRDTCLMLISAVAAHLHPFFNSPHLQALYHEAVWTAISFHAPLFTIPIMGKAVIPVLKASGPAFAASLLSEDVASQLALGAEFMLKSVCATLDSAWKADASIEHASNDLSPDDWAVVQDRAIRTASLEIARLFDALVFCGHDPHSDVEAATRFSPLFRLLLSSSHTQFISEFLGVSLRWMDSATLNCLASTVGKLVEELQKAVSDLKDGLPPNFAVDQALVDSITRSVLPAVIESAGSAAKLGIYNVSAHINLARDIWFLDPIQSAKALSSVSGSSTGAVVDLQKRLSKSTTKTSSRTVFRSFFQTVLRIQTEPKLRSSAALDVKQFSKVIANSRVTMEDAGEMIVPQISLFDT